MHSEKKHTWSEKSPISSVLEEERNQSRLAIQAGLAAIEKSPIYSEKSHVYSGKSPVAAMSKCC